jgi:WD40 repeat protein
MRHRFPLPGAVFLLLASWTTSPAQVILLGVSGNGSSSPGTLFTVNETTGEATLVNDVINSAGFSGVAISSDREMYTSSIAGLGTTSELYKLNPETGAILGNIGPISAPGGPISIGDLDFQPGTKVLYGIRSNADRASKGGEIYTIDLSTAAATLVGASEPVGSSGGLAFSPDGTLWRTGNIDTLAGINVLVQIDPNSASTIDTTMTGMNFYYDGLAVRPSDGVIFATGGGGVHGVHRIDPVAKTETALTPGPAHSLSDLAFDPGFVPTRLVTWGRLKQAYGARE